MEEKLVDSHIQMPKSVLKRFEDKNHRFYYFDVKGGFIGNNGHSGKINTKLGFYSKEAEEFLNKNIEKPFSELFEVIDGISIDPPQGHIDAAFDYKAKRFVYALMARNPDSIDRINEYSFITYLLTPQQSRDMGMILGFAAEAEREILASYGTTVAFNTTEIPFVLPTCGAYYLNIMEMKHVVLPISPKKAIVFVEDKGKQIVIYDGVTHPYLINDVEDVEQFNIGAFSAQCRYGNGYVVSPNREALEAAKRNVFLNEQA